MSEAQAIKALREKRRQIADHIHDLEKKIARQRAHLANLDAAMRLLEPNHPDAVPAKRPYRRTRYFGRNELSRLVMDTMRTAGRAVTAREIALTVVSAKGLPETAAEQVTDMVLAALRNQAKRGDVTKSGTSRDARWSVAGQFTLS